MSMNVEKGYLFGLGISRYMPGQGVYATPLQTPQMPQDGESINGLSNGEISTIPLQTPQMPQYSKSINGLSNGEISRASQVGNGGYHNAITGGTEGDNFDRYDINPFASAPVKKTTAPIKQDNNNFFANIAKNMDSKVFDGKKISTIDAMEMLNQLHSKQSAVREAGFQG